MGTVDHYADRYWNDLPAVAAYLCRRSTGDPTVWWTDHVKARYATPPRRRALVIGCGNGWVERDLADRDIAEHFDAFDGSPDYLKVAEERRGTRPIRYFRADFDTYRPDGSYDLIVNVAALHHVRYLYRMSRLLAGALTPDGLFINWEYVGPSRNQYAVPHVTLMQTLNAGLPERFRSPHGLRPSLHAFLTGDPTEAVHSAEILRAVEDYFELVERKDLGGGIAYQILWNNIAEFEKDDAEAREVLSRLLEADEDLTRRGTVPSLFCFFVARARRSRPGPRAAVDRLLREPVREALARASGMMYPDEIPRAIRAVWAGRLPLAEVWRHWRS